MSVALASVASLVHGAPHSSTTGTRCGGLTGCATRQRARPASSAVKCEATIADVLLARIALGRRQPIEFREDDALDLHIFREVFLHPRHSGYGIGQPGAELDARKRRPGIVGQTRLLLLRE